MDTTKKRRRRERGSGTWKWCLLARLLPGSVEAARSGLILRCALKVGENFKELRLEGRVELHEDDVGEVPEEKDEGLPPLDDVVEEEDDEDDEGNGVEGDVSDKGPGGQLQSCMGACVRTRNYGRH